MLCLSQTTGYAIKALALLDSPGGQPRLLRDLARTAGIPYPYLAKRMPDLAAAGLVLTKRGHRGGILLSRPPEQITLLQVSEAVENREWLDRCLLGLETCSDERACPMHQFWKASRAAIEANLRSTTLADVVTHQRRLEAAPGLV